MKTSTARKVSEMIFDAMPGHLHQRDDARERRCPRHQDDLVAIGRQRDAQPCGTMMRRNTSARDIPQARAASICPNGNRQDAAANDLAGIRPAVLSVSASRAHQYGSRRNGQSEALANLGN
jgi:hypothetical protein